jgi:16S rRNA U516 pseudouridylate synthase RsuA-like enzyme
MARRVACRRTGREAKRPAALIDMLIAFNKPYGVLSQFTDRTVPPRRTLADFGLPPRVYAAGRLDFDSEGLLLLTDDGAVAHRLSDPRHKQPKTYWVQVEGDPPARPACAASRRRRSGRAIRRCASARPCPMPGWKSCSAKAATGRCGG